MRAARPLACLFLLIPAALPAPARADDGPPPAKAPAPLAEAAGRMTVPEGFRVTLFAGEPDVRQPIALAFDGRGRLWVAECYSYPAWLHPERSRRDRILIFEDTDNDGRFDKRKVFWDRGANITGLELGFGGVWVCSTPELLFLPDRDGDDVPDGEPQVVLDGWDTKAQHNMFNGLIWGPDGWLWGCNGIMSNSRVGAPGTPDDRRVPINCGVWRYQPTQKRFEAVAHGTTNPWGLDFDSAGEPFITNCVIPHLYRVIPGAHYERMYGQDINPYSYGLIGSSADHIHWAGGRWQDSRGGAGKHGEAGGGHAHVGAMIYLGGSWPERYRDTVFTCNIHGNRLNNDTLRREGSGYVASHAPDFLMAHDTWFRGIAVRYGPDGSAFVIDWSDTDECHDTDANGPERETGRIYKVAYGRPDAPKLDLATADDAELVRLQSHPNDWHARLARRLLQERAAAGRDLADAQKGLRDLLASSTEPARQLRALWALYAAGGLDQAGLIALLDHRTDDVRAWAVRLLAQEPAGGPSADVVARLAKMAADEPSPRVRLHLASALQRIEPAGRWPLASALLAHGEDAKDAALPLMLWYGVEPLVPAEPARALALAPGCKVPLVRQYLARRAIDAGADAQADAAASLVQLLASTKDSALRLDLLRGMHEALRGRKSVPAPSGWEAASERLAADPSGDVRELALELALAYGDPKANVALRAFVLDPAADPERRRRALEALTEHRAPGLPAILRALLDAPALRGPAIRALAAYDDPWAVRKILDSYPRLAESERADAVATLAARPASARALLDALADGRIPRRDLPVAVARQILTLNDPEIAARLEQVWGSIRPPKGDKAARLAGWKAKLGAEALKDADPARGRLVFNATCGACHRLYDAGGDVGPDLTGSDRRNLDYVLENVLDPSAAVGRDYQLTRVATADGRVLAGIVREPTPTSLVLQTQNERLRLDRTEIEEMTPSPESMMPEGLFERLSEREVRDLIAYLATTEQVAPPREP